MRLLFDIAVIAILALFMLVGYKRGLIMMVFKLASFVLAIFLAVQLYPHVAAWLRETPMYSELQAYIIRSMGLGAGFEDIPVRPADVLGGLPLPAILLQALNDHATLNLGGLVPIHMIEAQIASFFAGMVVNIVAMKLIFIIVSIIMAVLSGALNIVSYLPVIKQFNRAGGLIFGLVQGVIAVWLALVVVHLLFLDPTQPALLHQLEASFIARWFYENNPILNLLSGT